MLLAAAFGTLSDIEALWIVIAVTSAIVTGFNLWDALLDRRALLAANIRNGRRIVSNVTIFTESTRIIIHLIFLSIGLLVAFLPEPPAEVDLPIEQDIARILLRWGLITASLILMAQSITLRWMRKKLRGD